MDGLFDARHPSEIAFAAKDEAMGRSEKGAAEDWLAEALFAVRYVAERRHHLTTDDVACVIAETSTHDTRALGPVMKRAAGKGWIEATDTYIPSSDPACHARPKRVWRSRIHMEAHV